MIRQACIYRHLGIARVARCEAKERTCRLRIIISRNTAAKIAARLAGRKARHRGSAAPAVI